MDARLKTLDRLFEAFNRHDADAALDCFSPDPVFYAAAGPEPEGRRIAGRDAIRSAFVGAWTAMPDVRWAVRRMSVHDGGGLAEWLFTGTDRDGRRIEVEGVDLFTFAGDLVASKSAFRKERVAA